MNDLNGFILGNFSSVEYGIIMTAPPPEVFAERDVEIISIPGRSGDLIKDNGRYKNKPIPYSCALLPRNGQSLRSAAIDAVNALHISRGYQRLEDTYNPGYFRMARISGGISVESVVEQAGTFTITFDCKPQRWLKSGEMPQVMRAASSLYNAGEDTTPIIKVYGYGAGTLTVGDTVVEICRLENYVILDCDLGHAYRKVGDGTIENMNGQIYAPVFPVLVAGANPISWTGEITHIEIIPRWWTL